jgi:2-polyprenyl-6-methoxyphenol hydroxylase-like FAD-dependent oxidoreductase
MKFCIIGSGIAGALLHNVLTRDGHEVVIYDKTNINSRSGFGFLLLENGVRGLKKLDVWKDINQFAKPVSEAKFYNPEGDLSHQHYFNEVFSISRHQFLKAVIDTSANVIDEQIELNENGTALLAGDEQIDFSSFDAVLGCDGANSFTRRLLNPLSKTEIMPTYELMGVVRSTFLNGLLGDDLHKYAIQTEGLTLGLLPVNDGEIIWYLQVNSRMHGTPVREKESLLDFFKSKVQHSENPMIQALLNAELETTYVWQGKNLIQSPYAAKNNVFLFGDAAHVVLPFTSQGTNSAIEDVAYFYEKIKSGLHPTEFSEEYSRVRLDSVKNHVQFGLDIMNAFCSKSFDEVSQFSPISIRA